MVGKVVELLYVFNELKQRNGGIFAKEIDHENVVRVIGDR